MIYIRSSDLTLADSRAPTPIPKGDIRMSNYDHEEDEETTDGSFAVTVPLKLRSVGQREAHFFVILFSDRGNNFHASMRTSSRGLYLQLLTWSWAYDNNNNNAATTTATTTLYFVAVCFVAVCAPIVSSATNDAATTATTSSKTGACVALVSLYVTMGSLSRYITCTHSPTYRHSHLFIQSFAVVTQSLSMYLCVSVSRSRCQSVGLSINT